MHVAILDDYTDTLRTLPCFDKLAGHEVTIWNDHTDDLDVLAERLSGTRPGVIRSDAPRVYRAGGGPRLIGQRRSARNDVDACTDLGIGCAATSTPGAPRRHRELRGRPAARGGSRSGPGGRDAGRPRSATPCSDRRSASTVRLVPETRGIVTAGDLDRMRPSALFVNTSRAGLVAPGVLEAALAAGRPGSAALDVFAEEPFTDGSSPLLTNPNVVATPHLGYVTYEELDVQFATVFDQINDFVAGRASNVVNPAALDHPRQRRSG